MNYLLLMGSAGLTLTDVTLVTGVGRTTVKAIATNPEAHEGKITHVKVMDFFRLVEQALAAGALPIPRTRGQFVDRRSAIREALSL